MVRTNTEYMSDKDTLDYVINRFINMTVKEFNDIDSNDMNDTDKEIIDMEELSEAKMQNMTYIELAFLIQHVGGNTDYDDYYSEESCDSFSLCRLLCRCYAKVLLAGDESSIPVRLFLAIPLEAFFDYMISVSNDNNKKVLKMMFDYMKDHCAFYPDRTIKDFIKEKIRESNKAWSPGTSLDKYKNSINGAYGAIRQLLVTSFYIAFSDKYNVEDICRKYQFDDKEYYEEFDEDFLYELDEDEIES